jgi:hypothetical protein
MSWMAALVNVKLQNGLLLQVLCLRKFEVIFKSDIHLDKNAAIE